MSGVLAVMDAEVSKAGRANAHGERYRDLRRTRDAIAELIAADREYDEARAAYELVNFDGNPKAWPPHDEHPATISLEAAKARRVAALARIGGAS